MGKVGIENRMDQMSDEANPFSFSLRAGGLYDTRVGASSTGVRKDLEDAALALNVNAGWQIPVRQGFGFRLGYGGYADFHEDFDEYDVVDQTVTAEPQWIDGQVMYSLPVGYNYVLEDGESDYQRMTVAPTCTVLFPRLRQAVEVYALYSSINDDDDFVQNEDGDSFGGGGAYIFQLENKTRFRVSLAFQYTAYDAVEADYIPGASRDSRRDKAITANADVYVPILSYLGLYADYSYIHANSSVELYDYDRNIIEGGVAIRY